MKELSKQTRHVICKLVMYIWTTRDFHITVGREYFCHWLVYYLAIDHSMNFALMLITHNYIYTCTNFFIWINEFHINNMSDLHISYKIFCINMYTNVFVRNVFCNAQDYNTPPSNLELIRTENAMGTPNAHPWKR